ncbi:MAG: hypothetical protein ACON4P_00335 [Candidatus Puniceispirillales bacterium]
MMRTIATLMAAAMLASPLTAMANQTTIKTVVGTVESVDVLTSSYIRKTPTEEKVCHTEEVPVYAEGEEGDEIGGLIIGGLIGSAVGNAVTKSDGAGTFGAVTGALIGREHAKSKTKQGKIVGYRQQDVCEIKKIVREERIEEITGYRLSIDIGGDVISLKSSRSYDQGDEINVRMKTTYSLD